MKLKQKMKPPKMKPPTVCILVPSGTMVHADFTQSLALMACQTTASGVSVCFNNVRLSNIAYSREELARNALTTDCSHFLWIDSDMVFPPWSLLWLLSRQLPIVASSCAKRGDTLLSEPACYGIDGQEMTGELAEARVMGFAFVLMKREVLERMERPRFPLNWNAEREEHMGEDNGFCDKARALGYKLMIDLGLSRYMGHAGEYIHMLYDKPLDARQAREICRDPNPPRIPPRPW